MAKTHAQTVRERSPAPHPTASMARPSTPSSRALSRAVVPRVARPRAIAALVRASAVSPAYDAVVRARVDALAASIARAPGRQRFVAIAGPPGGGKSTLAEAVRDAYNARVGRDDACVVVPMDGFHYSLAYLDAQPDARELRRRRGAPWTFDAEAFVRCVRELRANGRGDVPTFDHATHDPVPGGLRVERANEVVLVEGNYLLLPERPWADLVEEKAYDETWFVDTDVDEAMRRVTERHVRVGRTEAEARTRAETNDGPNARLIVEKCRSLADVLIPSVRR